MYAVYRVRRPFGWDGWQYSPKVTIENEQCVCVHSRSPNRPYSDACMCMRVRTPGNTAGDIFVVQEGHPRLNMLLASKCVVYDATLDRESILDQPQFQRLTRPLYGVGPQRKKLYYNG